MFLKLKNLKDKPAKTHIAKLFLANSTVTKIIVAEAAKFLIVEYANSTVDVIRYRRMKDSEFVKEFRNRRLAKKFISKMMEA